MAHDHAHHDHSHAHDHSHGHAGRSHAPDNFGWAFAIGATLNTAFVIAELIFGYAANSLALISDAVHNLSDVVALLLAWGAAWLSQKQPTQRHTYGYRRAPILAALFNAGLLLVAVGGSRSDFSLARQAWAKAASCFALVSHGDSRPAT